MYVTHSLQLRGNMSYCLGEFVHIRPRFEREQAELLEWTAKLHETAALTAEPLHSFVSIKERLFELGSGKEKIQKRGFQISDPFQGTFEEMDIYPVTVHPAGVGFKDRMLFFDKEVTPLFEQFYPEDIPLPEHLIHVTCTGYVAPSAAQKLISKRGGSTNTIVTHAYHMGCYASIPAIRIAAGSLALNSFSLPSPNPVVDIVHTEVCSLHMHPLRHTTEQLIVQSLFADGFIKYSVFKEDTHRSSLKILALLEEIIPDSIHSMTWSCDDVCHAMTLNKNVPVFITRTLDGYFSRLAQKAGMDASDIKKQAYFAIHPGGPKILQHIQQLFSLDDQQVAHSLFVLQNYGNMSSATLPHIWEKILKDDKISAGAFVVSLAFGPGLSITGGLFQKL